MQKLTYIFIAISALVVLAGVVFSTYVTFQYNQPRYNITTDENAVAYHGYDIVSYFKRGVPQKGREQYQYHKDGVTWYFSSLEHQQSFTKDSNLYQAQYGGYDAYGMAIEALTRPSDPQIWSLRGGKLYFFSNLDTMQLWNSDISSNQKEADKNWHTILKKLKYLNEKK